MTTIYAYEDGNILTWGDLRRDYVQFVTWATVLSFQAGLWVWEVSRWGTESTHCHTDRERLSSDVASFS